METVHALMLGTKNSAKIGGVQAAFTDVREALQTPDLSRTETWTCQVDTGVSDEPWGFPTTVQGAQNRAQAAYAHLVHVHEVGIGGLGAVLCPLYGSGESPGLVAHPRVYLAGPGLSAGEVGRLESLPDIRESCLDPTDLGAILGSQHKSMNGFHTCQSCWRQRITSPEARERRKLTMACRYGSVCVTMMLWPPPRKGMSAEAERPACRRSASAKGTSSSAVPWRISVGTLISSRRAAMGLPCTW